MSVYSCFYGTEAQNGRYPPMDSPSRFPVLVAYNPKATDRRSIKVYTPVPQEHRQQGEDFPIDTGAVAYVDEIL